jgi:hypothetical protein
MVAIVLLPVGSVVDGPECAVVVYLQRGNQPRKHNWRWATVDARAAAELGIQRVGGRSVPAQRGIVETFGNGGWVLPVDANFDLASAA